MLLILQLIKQAVYGLLEGSQTNQGLLITNLFGFITLGFGYYCSEIVWASWKHAANIDLDPTGGRVSPADIYYSPRVEIYMIYYPN